MLTDKRIQPIRSCGMSQSKRADFASLQICRHSASLRLLSAFANHDCYPVRLVQRENVVMLRKSFIIALITLFTGEYRLALAQSIVVANSPVSEKTGEISIDAQNLADWITTQKLPEIYFAPSKEPYKLGNAVIPTNQGIFHFASNTFSGKALGQPEVGHGLFTSTYTNPWNVVTDLKYEFDPAAHRQADHVTNLALSIECRPNHRNEANQNPNRNWVACVYRGMDSGTDGEKGTSISSEIDNDVLNLSSNSATDMEIDVNFNGKVNDGGWSRALFLTGGGRSDNNTNSIALEIMHRAYDHSWLPWTTGIGIRDALNMIQMHKSHANEAGFFIRTFDENQIESSHLDKNGYLDIQGLRLIASSTPSIKNSCKKGQITWDDNYMYLCISNGKFKKVPLQSL